MRLCSSVFFIQGTPYLGAVPATTDTFGQIKCKSLSVAGDTGMRRIQHSIDANGSRIDICDTRDTGTGITLNFDSNTPAIQVLDAGRNRSILIYLDRRRGATVILDGVVI